MPAYVAGTAKALNPGDSVVLSSASLPGLKSAAVAVGPSTDAPASNLLTINNESAVVLTVQFAQRDLDADYQAYSYLGTAVTVAANSANTFPAGTGFIRVLAASDPGAANISITR
jgi:hypothetical protein